MSNKLVKKVELKPCPFCGGRVSTHLNPMISMTFIVCPDCGAVTSFQGHEDEEGAIMMFNRRTLVE